jgi:hypothetical protein
MSHWCLRKWSTIVEKESIFPLKCSGGASPDHLFVGNAKWDFSVWCELLPKNTFMGQVSRVCPVVDFAVLVLRHTGGTDFRATPIRS